MIHIPSTIRKPEIFLRSPSAGFDGIMHYQWVNEAFRESEGFASTRITGMDFDCVVERCGHFLDIESKDEGTSVPLGQQITLGKRYMINGDTLMIVWGKKVPKRMCIVWGRGLGDLGGYVEHIEIESPLEATEFVRMWRGKAESRPILCPDFPFPQCWHDNHSR
jgi:hypothetical protein